MMRARSTLLVAAIVLGAAQPMTAQRNVVRRYDDTFNDDVQRRAYSVQQNNWRHVPHYGKWLTAAGVAAFTVVAATEHRLSRRDWNSLLTICRSAQDACAVGADGRYVRPDAEALYQRSREYDRRANRWLVGAQASLIATTALFIIDLRPGQGPDNIPFSPLKVAAESSADDVRLGFSLSF